MPKIIDLQGEHYGRLTVIGEANRADDPRNRYWLCLCDCGRKSVVRSSSLRNGRTRSCGCHPNIKSKTGRNSPKYKHGLSGQRIYTIWQGMKQRCSNPRATEYAAYGGRGISVCDEWQHDVRAFYEWAIANGYSDDLTIDRIDVNGNYCPTNCRWITQKEQYSNMRRQGK